MNKPYTFFAYLKLVRIGNLLMIAFSLSLFYYLILVPVHQDKLLPTLLPFSNLNFVLFVLSIVLVAAAGNVINDYLDFEADKEYKPNRPLTTGAISLDTAVYLHGVFAIAGIAIGFYLGWLSHNLRIGYIYIMAVLLLYLYSAFLKKIVLLGNILIAALTGFIFVLLLMFESNYLQSLRNFIENGNIGDLHLDSNEVVATIENVLLIIVTQVRFYAGFAFIISLAREIVKDLEDREGDAAHKVHTLPVQLGERAGKITVVLVLVGLLGGLSYVMAGFAQIRAFKELSYLLFTVAIPVVILIGWILFSGDAKPYRKISTALKIIMLMGVLSIPAFYLFEKMS